MHAPNTQTSWDAPIAQCPMPEQQASTSSPQWGAIPRWGQLVAGWFIGPHLLWSWSSLFFPEKTLLLDSHSCQVLPASPWTSINASLIATDSLWPQQGHRGDERWSAHGIYFYHVDAEVASLEEGEVAHWGLTSASFKAGLLFCRT